MGNQSLRAVLEDLAARWADQPTDYDEDTEQQIDDGKALREVLAAHPEPQLQLLGRPFNREAAITALEPYMKCSPQLAREQAARALEAVFAGATASAERPVQPGYDAVYAVLGSANLPVEMNGFVWRAVHAFREALGIRATDPLIAEEVEAARPKWTDLFGIAPDMTAEQLFGVDPDAAKAERYRLAWKSAYRRAHNFRLVAVVLGRQQERQQLVEEALGTPLRRQSVREEIRAGINRAVINGAHAEAEWSPSDEVDRITDAVMALLEER